AVEILRARGLGDFMVQAGGDLYVAGEKGDRPWRVGIRDPRGDRTSFFAAAEVTDATFSTSGDYERFFVKDGVRYHHIIDPDVGRPASGTRSVTIMAPSAITADALSTGLFILGAEKGLEVVEELDGVGAVFVDGDNQVHISPRLDGKVKILHAPSPGL
ncbi:MAG TPA: FAD:protein FMN transferase, partial [Sandaracinaceae bacterium LLY-WYZ-13_1]|nr:FAD:protein FMN transferase [Sandaracinaceae bacterium LLY-WYZ-13_1]